MRLFRKKSFILDEYEPTVIKWRASLAPFIKSKLAPAESRRRWWWNRLFVQVHDQYFFQGETRETILQSLQPAAGRSHEILAEAEALLAEENTRRDCVEQRSAGLQGAVAIAAGFGLAGAGLILDPSKLPTTGWRIAVGVSYLFTIICLAGTGFRALRATVRVHAFESPDPEGPPKRAGMTSDESNLHRAAELLYTYGRNQPLGDYKVTQMRASGHWFSGALVGLLLTAILACVALLDHPASHSDLHSHTNAKVSRVDRGGTLVPSSK
jgi:hypothetical protein